MHEDFFRAVEKGATVITASGRLARVLRRQYHGWQREQDRAVWTTPDILPLNGFLARAWWEHVMTGGGSSATLLNTLQEQVVWEQVIRESPAGDSLLRIPETAQQAMAAWGLVQSYRLPVDGRFEATEDWAAFAGWSRALRKRCAPNNWLEASRLPDVIAELLRSGTLRRPAELLRAGFEELTPQQAELFEALGGGSALDAPNYEAAVERWRFRDNTEEIQAAAAWARRMVEQNPAAQIGVIVPDLTRTRAKVERIFRETLDAGARLVETAQAFHVSLGPSLSQYPVVRAALLVLEFAFGHLTLPQTGMLLRSPFLGGASTEWTKRAQVDAELRNKGVWDVTPALLRERAGNCPVLQGALEKFGNSIREMAAEQAASDWSRDFSKLLEALGWPGDRTLSSREYQVLEKWRELLGNLAALDVVAPPMSFSRALDRLRQFAAELPFQIENEGAPVQVMGLLEASGAGFDHLWVMGLHDEALPAAANPNPFLPVSLQREQKLPHSSAEQELDFATKVMDQILGSARRIVLSYPAAEGDRVLGPSALVAGDWREAVECVRQAEWVRRMREAAAITELHDEVAPAVSAESTQTGGTSLFKDMAACPFRAFAKHRLGTRPLDESELGLSYRDRGGGVHKALEAIWRELKSHARLMELSPDELQQLISRAARAAVRQTGSGIGRKLEERRLEKLLGEWLELEKTRAPFTVRATEEKRDVRLGGLQVQTRADRVDRLADGREVILDYKTGLIKAKAWQGDRPDEPQIPLYCATNPEPVAAAAFGVVRTGELRFRGITEGATLPSFKKMELDAPLTEQMEQWKRVLEALAVQFRDGRAEVDPKSEDSCEHCGLRGLCRIREYENDRG